MMDNDFKKYIVLVSSVAVSFIFVVVSLYLAVVWLSNNCDNGESI